MKKILLSSVAAAMVATTLSAGIVTTTPVTVASELNTIPDSIDLSTVFMDTNITDYTPVQINLTDLSNPIFNIFAANSENNDSATGTINLVDQAGRTYCIVEDINQSADGAHEGDKVIALATTTTGNKLSFDGTNETATNGHQYVLRSVVDSNATVGYVFPTAANDDNSTLALVDNNLTVTGASASSFIRVNLGSGDTNSVNDRAGDEMTTSSRQVTSEIDQLFNGVINSTDNSYTFQSNFDGGVNTTEYFDFNITVASKDIDAVGANDDITVVLNTTKALPAGATYDLTEIGGTAVTGHCTAPTNNGKTLTCTLADAQFNGTNQEKEYRVSVVTDGTSDVLKATTFTAGVEYTFVTDSVDYNASNLLLDLTATPNAAGQWTYYGYNAIIPAVTSTGTNKTFAKFNNDSNNEAFVYWTLTGSNGCKTTTLFEANAFEFAADDAVSTIANGTLQKGISGLWDMETVATAANASGTPLLANGTGAACTIGNKYSAEVLITTARDSVHGHTVIRLNGTDTTVPVYTKTTAADEYISE